MRTIGLILLVMLVIPTAARAAKPPALTTYTVSSDTIYPAATATSGLATTTVIDVAFSEPVRASIKILSVGGATVRSLYSSTSVTNPTPKTWNGMNDAGVLVDNGTYTILVSATSVATGLSMTDSSRNIIVAAPTGSDPGVASPAPSDTASTTDTATVTAPAVSGGTPEYLPIPMLRIVTSGDRTVSASSATTFTAAVYDAKGNKRDDAIVMWTFGDGTQKTGASVLHEYYGPGEYLAVVHASTADGGDISRELTVTAKEASISIASVSPRGVELANRDTRALDLSFWRISASGQEFKMPENTQILPGRTILIPSRVLGLPTSDSAKLLYPNGEMAAAYPPAAIVPLPSGQPLAKADGYISVQAVEPISSTKAKKPAHVQAIAAPAATTQLAAAGAAFAPASSSTPDDSAASPNMFRGLFRSPWALSLLGVMGLAGGAFIFL